MTRIICGVDVASRALEARVGQTGPQASFANTPEGIIALAAFCRQHGVELVAVEATGGYEQQALGLLSEQQVGVAILNPRAVRQFAQAMGSLEKTDAIDAGMIAWYAEVKNSQPMALLPASQQKLRALVLRLRQLTETRVTERHQARLVTEAEVLKHFKRLLVGAQFRAVEIMAGHTYLNNQFRGAGMLIPKIIFSSADDGNVRFWFGVLAGDRLL